MSIYLKNMAGYKHNQLKNQSFDDIQKLFDKAIKRVNTFVDMDTELVEGSEVRVEGSETRAEGSSKRAGEDLQQESTKKQKVDEDRETAELKIICLKVLDRKDLETLYKLVKAKYGSKRPVEDLDLVLYGDLKTMFEPHVEDNGRIVGIKRLLDNLEVTAAQLMLLVYKLLLLVFRVNAAGTKSIQVGSTEHYPHLDNGIYNVVDRVMRPLALKQTRKPRSDRGKARHSISSTYAHHNRGSSSHQGDDDEDDGTSRASTPSPTIYLNSLKPLNYQSYDIPNSS
ncbi:hypothetical protein Tco_0361271 [Tanacetum coccineum]